jgi:bilirubin oxidase
VIQDRSFTVDGALFYPPSRRDFDDFAGPYVPGSDIAPIFNPEVFGTTLVVNGRTWPKLEVEPRRYRLRLLNGCNARFLLVKVVSEPLAERPAAPTLPFTQIGNDGGFLPHPVERDLLLLGPAERADVIVDFSEIPVGTALYLINEGPDEPFGGGAPGSDFEPADPETTGQVMQFIVIPLAAPDETLTAEELLLPPREALGSSTVTRRLSVSEEDSEVLEGVGPREALLGTMDDDGQPIALEWTDPITEKPALNTVETWEIHNFTEDAHPIHLHQVQFEIIDRKPFNGPARPAEAWEAGAKDMVIVYPREITRINASFDRPGLYAWHCHIVEHEDHEMMRPIWVGP